MYQAKCGKQLLSMEKVQLSAAKHTGTISCTVLSTCIYIYIHINMDSLWITGLLRFLCRTRNHIGGFGGFPEKIDNTNGHIFGKS